MKTHLETTRSLRSRGELYWGDFLEVTRVTTVEEVLSVSVQSRDPSFLGEAYTDRDFYGFLLVREE